MYYGCELRVDSPTGIATGCSMFLNKTSTRRRNVEASLAQLYPRIYSYHHSLTWWIVQPFTLACIPFAVELDFLKMNCLCCENKLKVYIVTAWPIFTENFYKNKHSENKYRILKKSSYIKHFIRVVLSNTCS